MIRMKLNIALKALAISVVLSCAVLAMFYLVALFLGRVDEGRILKFAFLVFSILGPVVFFITAYAQIRFLKLGRDQKKQPESGEQEHREYGA